MFCSAGSAQEGLVQWFTFEGSGDIAKDESGNGNDGTIVGATRVPGRFGKGISIGQKDEYVEIAGAVLQSATTI